METALFHELEHEPKMRLLKTHSHTSERQGNEAGHSTAALFARRLGSETTGRARVQRCHALHSPWPAGSVASRLFVVFLFKPAPSLFGGNNPEPKTPLVMVRACGTLCISGQVCLIKSVLVGTHVCCLLRDGRRAALFLSCTLETETKLVPLWKTAGFRRKIRLPSTTNNVKIRSKRGTLYFWTGLPIISLLLTCVDCFEIEEEQLYSFQARRRMRPSSCLAGKPWFST